MSHRVAGLSVHLVPSRDESCGYDSLYGDERIHINMGLQSREFIHAALHSTCLKVCSNSNLK